MPWIPQGLREGIVTTRYPRRPDDYGPTFHGALGVEATSHVESGDIAAICPTGAISASKGVVTLDRGRCILCGLCVEARPDLFAFSPGFENSTHTRSQLVVPGDLDARDDQALATARRELRRRVKALRRSVHVRHIDAGSDGSEEWEVAALTNPIYDVQRLGIYFTASPKHADLLLVTGVGSAGMRQPLAHTYEVMPEPKVVIAAGTDAIGGGLVGSGYASAGGIGELVPVDVFVPGSPPSPFGLLHGILLALGLLGSGQGDESHRSSALRRGAAHGPTSPEDPPVEVGP